MSKSVKLTNDTYLDTSSIVHNKNKLSAELIEIINNLSKSIKIGGILDKSISFDALMTNKKSTCYTFNESSSSSKPSGFPTSAYGYGVIITINPECKTESYWGTVQIYIPDIPSKNGIYFRTRTNNTWLKITGTAINPIT